MSAPRTTDLVWLLAMAFALGAAAVLARAPDPAALLLRNEGPPPHALPTLALGLLVPLSALALARRGGLAAAVGRLVRGGRWLVGLPLLALFFLEPSGHAGVFAPALAVAVAGLAAASAYAWDGSLARWPRLARLLASPRLPPLLLLAVFGAGWARLSWLALVRHGSLASRVYDLGIYDNLLWNTIHGRLFATDFVRGGHHFQFHVDPILGLLAPLYALAPGAALILVVQAGWLLAGAAPLYRLALRRLGEPWLAFPFALAYLLLPSIHGAALFDFHSLALAAPLVIWALDLAERGSARRFALAAALVVACREDMALLVAGLGLYLALGLGRRRLGAATVVLALAYFAAVKLMIQRESLPYARRYAEMIPGAEGGFGEVARTLVTNPGYALLHVATARKLGYLAALLAPVLALPLLAGSAWWTFGYGLAVNLLATNHMNFSPYSHHAVALFPVLFAAAPAGLQRAAELGGRLGGDASRVRRALALGVVVAALVMSARFGAFVDVKALRGEPHLAVTELDEAARARLEWVRRAAAQIPGDAAVAASNHIGAHLAARDRIFFFPDPERRSFDFVLLDRRDFRERGEGQLQGLRRAGFEVIDSHADELFLLRSSRAAH